MLVVGLLLDFGPKLVAEQHKVNKCFVSQYLLQQLQNNKTGNNL